METKQDTPLMETSSDTQSDKHSDKMSRTCDLDDPQPPDGGFWAWLVLVGCFLVNGIIFGIINTFGILFVQLKKDMVAAGVEDAATKCGKILNLNTVGSIKKQQFMEEFCIFMVNNIPIYMS